MRLERMKEEHIKAIQHIARTTWAYTYEGIIPEHIQCNFLNHAYSDEMMQRRLKTHLFVVHVENEVIGFANYSNVKENGAVELAAIYILPSHQGKGVGSLLLKEGENLQGALFIECNVEKENRIGLNFYLAKGFQQVDEFEDLFDGHPLQTIRLRKEIKATKR